MYVKEILTRAISKSLVSSFQDQNDAQYISSAFNILLDLIDELRDVIPYYEEFTFNTLAELKSKPFYDVGGIKYYINNVSYILYGANQLEFQRLSNIKDLKSLPSSFYIDDVTGLINIYPEPTNGENFLVWGTSREDTLGLTSKVPTAYPRFFINYLIQEISYRLCCDYNVDWSEIREALRRDLRKKVMDSMRHDISCNFSDNFSDSNSNIPTRSWWALAK